VNRPASTELRGGRQPDRQLDDRFRKERTAVTQLLDGARIPAAHPLQPGLDFLRQRGAEEP
jgi:hypothetical protein